MNRLFVLMPEFDSRWKRLGLDDEDLSDLEDIICADPSRGDVIEGTHGLRKIRFAVGNRGKSAGVRVLYADFPEFEKIYFFTLFSKNEKDNISKKEKTILGHMITKLHDALKRNVKKDEKRKTTTKKK